MSRTTRALAALSVVAALGLVGCGDDQPPVARSTDAARCGAVEDVEPGSTTTLTIDDRGTERTYVVHVPKGYDAAERVPLVVALHGFSQDATAFATNTRLVERSDREGFVLVAPQGRDAPGTRGDVPFWNFLEESASKGSDLPFVTALVERVQADYCIDTGRTYAAGFSNGSALVFALACQDDSPFAAFAGVAATFYPSSCAGRPPASILYFHGQEDTVVPFDGSDDSPFGTVPPAATSMARWAQHDGCDPSPTVTPAGEQVERYRWNDCTDDAALEAYVIADGGHQWPGGRPESASADNGFQTQEVSAAALIWRFFEDHPADAR
jgi:polyhydroxybutyrate depolymerase